MNALLAQVNRNAQNGPFGGDEELLIVILIVLGAVLLVTLIVYIFFLLTLSRALNRCAPENRTMEPGMVWLNLVPCLSLVWQFITVNRMAESLDNEYYDRGWRKRDDFGKGLGTTACVLGLLGMIPYIGGLFSLGSLVCGIIYWVKIAGYSRELASPGSDDERYDDDDYDDEPRKPRRRRRDESEDDYDDGRGDRD